MKIKTKLLISFSCILIILFIMGANVIQTLSNQNNNMNIIIEEYYERVRLAERTEDYIQKTGRLTRDLLLIQSPVINESAVSEIRENLRNLSSTVDQLEKLTVNNPEKMALMNELSFLCNTYSDITESVLIQIEKGNFQAGTNILFGDTSEVRTNLLLTIEQLTRLEEQSIQNVFQESVKNSQYSLAFNTFFLTISILIIVVVLYYIAQSITKSINHVRNVVKEIPRHSFEDLPRIKIQANNELADVAIAYNNLAEVVERFALKEKEITETLKQENWLKTNYAEVFSVLQGNLKIENFGQLFVNHLSNIVGATFGVFHLKKDSEKCFREISAYGGSGKKAEEFEVHKFKLGEGLAGQCALSNKVIYLKKLPADYVRTKSSLGDALPTSLIILPIPFEDEVIGTVELAKFEPFTVMEKKLLEQICLSIGTNIKRVLNHMEIESLLSKSQTLAEELQAQSEELQQQQEELRMVNEDLYTENKRSEEKNKDLLKMKNDLEDKNREIQLSSKYKSEFLANMSHELRTPLNSLLILAQILATNSERNLTEKQVEYANTIYTSGKDLLELINDILDLSKVEAGKIEVYPEEIALEDIIAFVKRQFSHMAEGKGLEFKVNIENDLPEYLSTDEQRLKQILKNLLANAFKFTDKGKVIFDVRKSKNSEKSKLTFSVIDTGIGIPKNSQEDIFTAFNQLDGTTSRKYGGSGLGLSISRELSELLGGNISVTSTEGEGSIFSLHLPDYPQYCIKGVKPLVAATKEELLIEDNEITLPMCKEIENQFTNECLEGKSVLIVDDDMRNIFALTSFLEGQKMVVSFAENGKDALDALELSTIDIVLMDIMMPEMNGFEAMIKIRKMDKFKKLPIIALTAKAMKEDREKCIKTGASDYISKPVKTEQLLSLMKVWLFKE